MKRILALTILLILSLNSWAKPRTIDFDKELKEAEIIRYGTVINYSDSTLKLLHLSTNDTLIFNCKGKPTADMIRQGSLEINPTSQELAGYWPRQNESVLIIGDKDMNIRLFAKKEKENYRFWDPNMDLLGSWFHFSHPELPAKICTETYGDSYYSTDCFDGCYYPINLINEK